MKIFLAVILFLLVQQFHGSLTRTIESNRYRKRLPEFETQKNNISDVTAQTENTTTAAITSSNSSLIVETSAGKNSTLSPLIGGQPSMSTLSHQSETSINLNESTVLIGSSVHELTSTLANLESSTTNLAKYDLETAVTASTVSEMQPVEATNEDTSTVSSADNNANKYMPSDDRLATVLSIGNHSSPSTIYDESDNSKNASELVFPTQTSISEFASTITSLESATTNLSINTHTEAGLVVSLMQPADTNVSISNNTIDENAGTVEIYETTVATNTSGESSATIPAVDNLSSTTASSDQYETSSIANESALSKGSSTSEVTSTITNMGSSTAYSDINNFETTVTSSISTMWLEDTPTEDITSVNTSDNATFATLVTVIMPLDPSGNTSASLNESLATVRSISDKSSTSALSNQYTTENVTESNVRDINTYTATERLIVSTLQSVHTINRNTSVNTYTISGSDEPVTKPLEITAKTNTPSSKSLGKLLSDQYHSSSEGNESAALIQLSTSELTSTMANIESAITNSTVVNLETAVTNSTISAMQPIDEGNENAITVSTPSNATVETSGTVPMSLDTSANTNEPSGESSVTVPSVGNQSTLSDQSETFSNANGSAVSIELSTSELMSSIPNIESSTNNSAAINLKTDVTDSTISVMQPVDATNAAATTFTMSNNITTGTVGIPLEYAANTNISSVEISATVPSFKGNQSLTSVFVQSGTSRNETESDVSTATLISQLTSMKTTLESSTNSNAINHKTTETSFIPSKLQPVDININSTSNETITGTARIMAVSYDTTDVINASSGSATVPSVSNQSSSFLFDLSSASRNVTESDVSTKTSISELVSAFTNLESSTNSSVKNQGTAETSFIVSTLQPVETITTDTITANTSVTTSEPTGPLIVPLDILADTNTPLGESLATAPSVGSQSSTSILSVQYNTSSEANESAVSTGTESLMSELTSVRTNNQKAAVRNSTVSTLQFSSSTNVDKIAVNASDTIFAGAVTMPFETTLTTNISGESSETVPSVSGLLSTSTLSDELTTSRNENVSVVLKSSSISDVISPIANLESSTTNSANKTEKTDLTKSTKLAMQNVETINENSTSVNISDSTSAETVTMSLEPSDKTPSDKSSTRVTQVGDQLSTSAISHLAINDQGTNVTNLTIVTGQSVHTNKLDTTSYTYTKSSPVTVALPLQKSTERNILFRESSTTAAVLGEQSSKSDLFEQAFQTKVSPSDPGRTAMAIMSLDTSTERNTSLGENSMTASSVDNQSSTAFSNISNTLINATEKNTSLGESSMTNSSVDDQSSTPFSNIFGMLINATESIVSCRSSGSKLTSRLYLSFICIIFLTTINLET